MDTSAAFLPPESPSLFAGHLPTFSQPRKMPTDPPLPEDENQSDSPNLSAPEPVESERRSLFGRRTPKPEPSDTPTAISAGTGDKPAKADAKATAALVAGLLGLAFTGAAVVLKWRSKRVLREPTASHLDGIAAPLARIAGRHFDLSVVNNDLADGVKAAAALGVYLKDGPLFHSEYIDAGVPTDLQFEEN